MLIRHAQPSDRQEAARLVFLAIQDIAYQLTGEVTEAKVLKQLERFYETPGNRFSMARYLVADVEPGAIAGLILCYKGSQEEELSAPVLHHLQNMGEQASISVDRESDMDEFYIDALAVAPAYEGQGYAKALMKAAEAWALTLGITKMGLNVDLDKDRVSAIYRKAGYAEDKRVSINERPFRHMVKYLK